MHNLDVRQISAEETYPMRLEILRPGHPIEDAMFPGDLEESTAHFGAYSDDQLVGIVSIYRAPFPVYPEIANAWQLRGMATLPSVRGQGFGRALMIACLTRARMEGASLLWCNARTPALGFYRKYGLQEVGEEFQIEDAGPHYRMWIRYEDPRDAV
jgi:GNAT superfamily N-acetyltransferase